MNDRSGNAASDALHLDPVLAQPLTTNQAAYATSSGWDAPHVDAYAADRSVLDSLGSSIAHLMNADHLTS